MTSTTKLVLYQFIYNFLQLNWLHARQKIVQFLLLIMHFLRFEQRIYDRSRFGEFCLSINGNSITLNKRTIHLRENIWRTDITKYSYRYNEKWNDTLYKHLNWLLEMKCTTSSLIRYFNLHISMLVVYFSLVQRQLTYSTETRIHSNFNEIRVRTLNTNK